MAVEVMGEAAAELPRSVAFRASSGAFAADTMVYVDLDMAYI